MTTQPDDPRRKSDLARIHVLKSQLRMTEDDYRFMLGQVAGVESAAACTPAQRRDVIRHLDHKLNPWKANGRPAGAKPKAKPTAAGLLAKIEAQLTAISKPWAYAHGMAKKMFGIERVDWLDADQLTRIVAALTYYQRRQPKERGAP